MFGPIGMPELVIIFIIALIVFGPRKLPELGKSLGKSLAEFKRASNDLRSTLEEEIRIEDARAEAGGRPQASSASSASSTPKQEEPASEVSASTPTGTTPENETSDDTSEDASKVEPR